MKKSSGAAATQKVAALVAQLCLSLDVNDLAFSTLLNNITECKYFDIPNAKFPSSINNIITFLHINLRSINNQEKLNKFYEFFFFPNQIF